MGILAGLWKSYIKPHLTGLIGELGLYAVLRIYAGGDSIVLRDILLRLSSGDTTQIDAIVVSTKGVFVIEMKNYSGWIYGKSENDLYWTQYLHGRRYTFYNPVLQNDCHVRAVANLLKRNGIKKVKVHPLVVFGNRCRFGYLKIKSPVIHLREVPSHFRSYRDRVYSPEEVKVIADIIRRNNIRGGLARIGHIRRVRRNKKINVEIKAY